MTSPSVVMTNAMGYPQVRNIADLPFTKYRIQKRRDWTRIPVALSYRLLGKIPRRTQFSHVAFPWSAPAVCHFFNAVSFSRQPWLTSFETCVPRWEGSPAWYTRRALDAVASDWCLGIVAISQCAADIQDRFLEQEFPAYRDVVMSKCRVLHPAQQVMQSEYPEKPTGRLELLLVGNQIFSKGGREILSVVRKLSAEGADLRVTIVSGLRPDDYATFTGASDVARFREQMQALGACARFLGTVPNQQVLDLLKSSHIALLPTWADTYGYFVLEAQANGCPVISTNLRALPEINDSECGWLIDIPLDERRNVRLRTASERAEVSAAIETGLERCLRQCLENPALVEQKGRRSLQRIATEHCPDVRVRVLEEFYDRGFQMLKC